MTVYVLATDSVHASADLCDYLEPRLTGDDAVHAVNSRVGDEGADPTAVRDGGDALNVVRTRLGATASVETRPVVGEGDPADDVLDVAREVGADELVIGIEKRDPTAEVAFGSTAGEILLGADVPVAVVPLREA